MQLTANQFNRNPGQVFRRAAKGEGVTINHDQHPELMFEMIARRKKGAEASEAKEATETEITRISQRALDRVETDWQMSGLSSGIYGDYAISVAAEIFRQVMHVTDNGVTRDKIMQIANQIEEAKE